MNWFRYFFLGALVLILFSSCKVGKIVTNETPVYHETPFPYDFSKLKSYDLPAILSEVSGLTYDEKADRLLAVEDERGVIYSLDKNDGSILSKDKFHKDGDYEGITLVDQHIYVLKSTGTIYKVKNGAYNTDPEKIKGGLKKEFNLEGLTYDPYSKGLLVSCKEPINKEAMNSRCLFRIDIVSKKMSEKPFLVINREELKKYITDNFDKSEAKDKFKKIMNPDLDYLHLGPSGIAIHPFTKDIFIVSSRSKCLLVYDRDTKTLVHLQKLDKNIFEQPEGISFDAKGNLYISSESKKKPAQLCFIPFSTERGTSLNK